MNTMNAVILHALGGIDNFHLDRVVVPVPKRGEVRIRVKAAAFNPVDVKTRQGEYGECTPLILGADCSGVIDEVGEGVDTLAIGDEVYGMPFGQGSNGSYSQYVCIPSQFISQKPKNLSFEEAACIPLAALTAYRAVSFLRSARRDGPIFIAGAAGGVGSFAVQLVQHFHNNLIYTVAGSNDTAIFLREKLGIKKENILSYQGVSATELKERLIALNHGNSFLATFDFVGKSMKTLCIELAGYSGHIISTVPEDPKYELSSWSKGAPYFQRNLSLHHIFVGAEAYSGNPATWEIYHEHLIHLTCLLNAKKIKVPAYQLLGRLSVDTVKKAHRLLETGRVRGKLVMLVD